MIMELERLKVLLGISVEDNSQDIPLQFILDDVQETIFNYCNIKELPEGLTNTAYRMAIDLYRNENIGSAENAVGPISSLSEGDTSTSFSKYVDDNFKDTILKNYRKILNRYRRVVFASACGTSEGKGSS